jgi:release factor-specific protein-(glutamine-N5) methyltransferase
VTVREALAEAARRLAAAGIDTAQWEARQLVAHALGTTPTQLAADPDRAVAPDALEPLLRRREAREPLAYVLGEWGFRRLTLRTDARALVPRPETEVVVERCLALLAGLERPRVLDVGTGTGAIALAIADEHPGAEVTGIDTSAEALALARENAELTGLEVELREGGVEAAADGWDLVVSNPPYVAAAELEALEPEVRDWEPRAALVDTGLHERLARVARTRFLVLEVGDGQAESVARGLVTLGFAHTRITQDLAGKERVVEAEAQGRFATADGRTLAYRRAGSGPTLVCHPGGPGFSSRYFGADLGGLGDRLELVLLDPRGSRESDRPADQRGYRIEDYVDDLDELREQLGLERMSLLGHSHGGVVAMAYAARAPERIERLVLASTIAHLGAEQEEAAAAAVERHRDAPWYEDALAAIAAEEAGEFADDSELAALSRRFLPLYFGRYDEAAASYLETLADEIPNGDAIRQWESEIFRSFDLRPELERIEAPTLVITGDGDFAAGPAAAEEIARGIPGAELEILHDTGHFVFVESPTRFREAVWKFLGAAE